MQCKLDLVERTLIEEALRSHEGNVSRAADHLGVSRQGLYKKIRRLKIEGLAGMRPEEAEGHGDHAVAEGVPV